MNAARELVIRTVTPFFKQGAPRVYLTECHDRVYAGTTEASTCRTCKLPPKNVAISSLKDLDSPSQDLAELLERIESKTGFEPAP